MSAQQMTKFNHIFVIRKPLCPGALVCGRRYCKEQVHILPPQEDGADRKMKKKKNYRDENLIGEFRE